MEGSLSRVVDAVDKNVGEWNQEVEGVDKHGGEFKSGSWRSR